MQTICNKTQLSALIEDMKIRLVLGFLAGIVGCASEPQAELETIERCGKNLCGGNSPTIDHYGFWELNIHGVPNAQGFELLGLSQGNQFLDLAVENSTLIGRDAQGGELRGSGLIGATIWIQRGTRQYGIEISHVGTFDEVVGPFPRPIETYVLNWSEVLGNQLPNRIYAGGNVVEMPVLGGTRTNVCPSPIRKSGGDVEWDPTSGLEAYQTLLFEGDRFDLKGRVVNPIPEDDWFNIGCGSHTLAKLRLTRNTIHTAPAWQNVQAALKMLSADYCGTGRSFTVDGEPLVWRDRAGMDFWLPPRELEARWDENGATCIFAPRLERSRNPLAQVYFSWPDLQNECGFAGHPLPQCQQLDPLQWEGNELIISGNYD